MTATGMNGSRSMAGVEAMAAMTPAERMGRNARLKAFLDSGDADGMTKDEVAQAVGISAGAVYKEFARRGVPMTPGVPARYTASKAKSKASRAARPTLPRGEARERIENYLRTGGEGTLDQIAEATGVPRSTVGYVLSRMGLTSPAKAAAAEPELPREAVMAEIASLAPRPPGDAPEGKLVYLHQISDGRHVGLDLLTGTLWVMEATRPL